ncbi:mitochondrial carrier protein rim2 [Niveomyces insectorum RCEF 264]|uniref:Mitochondrial carrier protein rim2 n=1 Tax=Niveomyces insectorum RCEF 264 TaxID=1081102 RepID=A0A162J3R1_9HYPO|nr:mitochondrial carrier protein rim2 [Niveomyces insectorum RCEF 264]
MSQRASTNGLAGFTTDATAARQPSVAANSANPADLEKADVMRSSSSTVAVKNAKSWSHMVAGAVGSLAAATATAPFDVIRTRLQSDFYQQQLRAAQATLPATSSRNPVAAVARHLGETLQIFVTVKRVEGWRALFKGLGPTLVGTMPAKSINFYTYGNGKRIIADAAHVSQDTPWVQLAAGVVAGLATSTATNPIWLVKTRLQLDKNSTSQGRQRQYRNSVDCVRQVLRHEGIRGLYKGMTASYLGAAESTLHWLLYEQMKRGLERRSLRVTAAMDGPAGGGERGEVVVRTRLRQAPLADGQRKYTGLVQCFLRVWREERIPGLYGGLTPHLLRTVPAAGITFGIYEIVLKLLNAPEPLA